uniref:F-box domain-containing protein n=1 Tax=Oryza punctata TaxID=4537 RepID=A0A0E0LWA5_ORYPU
MKRKREEVAAAAAAARPGSSSSSSEGGICDDVVRNIFARLPARDAVASMAPSRRHRRLITSEEFRRLHCRHGAPLDVPHIAYVATADVVAHRDTAGRVDSLECWAHQRATHGFSSWGFASQSSYNAAPDRSLSYHGFHVAGRRGGTNPMRALDGQKYDDKKYVGTCNGVVLLAVKEPSVGFLLNPAVADGERKVSVVFPSSPDADGDTKYHISGFGYGPRTRTYKLLLCKHKQVANFKILRKGCIARVPGAPYYLWRADELVVYSLGGGAAEQPRTVLAGLDDDKIRRRSLYMDGTLLNADKETLLAFDVDDETITSIALPGERVAGGKPRSHDKSHLMEMSGRVCVATVDDGDKEINAVWMLTADRRNDCYWPAKVAGVWDCCGVLLIALQAHDESSIVLYDDATEEVFRLDAPPHASPEKSDYRICWGYKPTLVSPASIVGELRQDEQQRRDVAADVLAAVKPVNEVNKRKGQKATLHTVCFMEFLVGVMRNLPSKLHHGIADLDQFY